MKLMKLPLGLCLLLIFAMQQTGVANLFAQSASSANKSDTNQIQERINRVENNLLPPLKIKGEPIVKMNIAERMKFYSVSGVSVAVINNGKIEWAKGYGEVRQFQLPNSKIVVQYSTKFWELMKGSDIPFVPVDVPLQMSFSDYSKGHDAVLQAALDYKAN